MHLLLQFLQLYFWSVFVLPQRLILHACVLSFVSYVVIEELTDVFICYLHLIHSVVEHVFFSAISFSFYSCLLYLFLSHSLSLHVLLSHSSFTCLLFFLKFLLNILFLLVFIGIVHSLFSFI